MVIASFLAGDGLAAYHTELLYEVAKTRLLLVYFLNKQIGEQTTAIPSFIRQRAMPRVTSPNGNGGEGPREQLPLPMSAALGSDIMPLDKSAQKMSILHGCALGTHWHVPNPRLWFKGEQHTTGAVPFLFIIHAPGLPRCDRQRHQHSAQELTGSLVITEQRMGRIIGGRAY